VRLESSVMPAELDEVLAAARATFEAVTRIGEGLLERLAA
jgi:hypothetical protein